jgi:biotin-[acetyl-CoA-carboxylase] ligase BirA-like protein
VETIRLAVTDSTSAKARELLAQGKRAPFAVVAERQTAGRGRRGNTWESPPGNLYVTFALPPPAATLADMALAPLKAAVCCARALRTLLGVRLTVKWPNDLLFAGRKVGGLLCETSTSGDVAGELLVGLGLNTTLAPSVQGDDAPVPGALQELVGRRLDADGFLAEFSREWEALALGDVTAAFAEVATGVGQPWVEHAGAAREQTGEATAALAAWREAPLGAGGELVLEPIAPAASTLRLSSAEHRCTWAYAARGRAKFPLAAADCGNTRLKLALYAPADAPVPALMVAAAGDASTSELASTLAPFRARMPGAGWPLFVSSVNPEAAARLVAAAAQAGFSPVLLPKRRVRTHGDRYALAPLGADRLAAIEGALARWRKGWQLVVSAGTATTIDAVRADGWHGGGWILPGLSTGLAALHRAGRLLPDLEARDAAGGEARLGRDTRTAMLWGMTQMTIGAIERAKAVLELEHGQLGELRLVLTGGDADKLAPHLPGAEVIPSLVLEGARVLALGGV